MDALPVAQNAGMPVFASYPKTPGWLFCQSPEPPGWLFCQLPKNAPPADIKNRKKCSIFSFKSFLLKTSRV
jgi:hypothetical protein